MIWWFIGWSISFIQINIYNMQKLMYLSHLFQKWSHTLKPEALEQAKFVLWLEQHNYKYTAIPNSTWTKSNSQKRLNTMTWLNAGLCDMLIVLKRWSLLFLEMKLPWKILKSGKMWASPSKVSDEQKEWIRILSDVDNVMACLGYGCDHAKEQVEYYENL